MSTAILDMLRRVRPEVSGCPELVIEDAVREAAREFCRRTLVWRETLPLIDLIADLAVYELEVPTDALLWSVVSMRRLDADGEGFPIYAATEDELEHDRPGWQTATATSNGLANFIMLDVATTRFYPIPDTTAADAVEVKGALIPSEDATTLPDILATHYEQAVADGALAQLHMMRNRPWTDPNMAGVRRRLFARAIVNTQAQVKRGHANTRQQVRMPYFAGSRQMRRNRT